MSDNSNSDDSLFEGIKKMKIKNKTKNNSKKTVRFNSIRKNRTKQRIRTTHHKVPMGVENITARKSHKKGSLNVPDDLTDEEKEILKNSLKRFKLSKKQKLERMHLYTNYLKQKKNFNEKNNNAYILTKEEKEFLNSFNK
jgi:hypothetical protein